MTEKPQPVPSGKVVAYPLPGAEVDVEACIRPCAPQRDWMENSPLKFAKRCIPLLAANTMGWEIINPVRANIRWNGGATNADLEISAPQHPFVPQSHFGLGIATWILPFVFRTPKDIGLVVTGPANSDQPRAKPLDAFVRTDWLPFPFTMSWQMMEKDRRIRFEAGTAICRVFPFPLALLNEMALEVRDMNEDPGFVAEFNEWHARRQTNVAQASEATQKWVEGGEKPTGEGAWNSAYVRQTVDSDDDSERAQTIFKVAPPVDKRGL